MTGVTQETTMTAFHWHEILSRIDNPAISVNPYLVSRAMPITGRPLQADGYILQGIHAGRTIAVAVIRRSGIIGDGMGCMENNENDQQSEYEAHGHRHSGILWTEDTTGPYDCSSPARSPGLDLPA